ncbi:uncharacterized protein A1O9_09252 [Exophiala aquamarina CBS 119918]|uniref:3CxxC-type domain-containing protein n=1 Tax=Exophiala aquamarina CBS 119918 TaxID=1182545 RepID=A0A072PH27_9EURO|nr:uncharacterized protein A1O9_09252 [Exophiala aquamarina CBS 119918]KEF54810.1 hypothetical protein A1O9_09252 [Exophiala aquamarina CBS 119918]
MAGKKDKPPRPEPKAETRTSFMFPRLHKDVAKEVSNNLKSTWFNRNDSDSDVINEWQTNVMGRFRCTNEACDSKGWSSKKVAILIRGYATNGYNAAVFNQRCRECDQLGTFTLDKQSYIDRVAYRIQKWAGVELERQQYTPKRGLPHETEFCEGCKKGVCRQAGI